VISASYKVTRRRLTTTTGVHLSVWAELDTMDGTMVSLQDFSLLASHSMDPDPFVT
jgi:hypothetical protein